MIIKLNIGGTENAFWASGYVCWWAKYIFLDGLAFIEHIAEVAAVKLKRKKPPQNSKNEYDFVTCFNACSLLVRCFRL